MSDTSGRLFRLLSLLQTYREWTGPELADRLSVSTRTIRNDVERLRSLGYPVHATYGKNGGYRLGAGAQMPPLVLDDDEAVAVAVGLSAAVSTSIEGIEETSLRALAKLKQVLPNRLRRRVNALQTQVEPLRWGSPQAVVNSESLAVFSQACRDGEQVRFGYADREGAESRRLVDPYRLVLAGRRWYLVAWDVRRQDWRTFRVDRTSRPHLAGVRFARRELPAADAATYVQQALAAFEAKIEAIVVLEASVEDVSSRLHHSLGSLEPINDRRCRLRMTGDNVDWMAFRLGLLGVDFTVESPQELIDCLRVAGARMSRAATH